MFNFFKKQFTKKELKLIKYCLDYSWHRAAKHSIPAISNQEKQINKLRKKLCLN